MTLPIKLPTMPPPAELAEAVTAVTAAPDRPELWDEAERLAADLQRPEDVALAYDTAIHGPLPKEVALELCQRAVGFLAEWFEDKSVANAVLNRAIAVDPSADWAFQRLTMTYTVERNWDELLSLYDRVIAGTTAPARRSELYGEAAQIAKDLAGRADRAIEYLEHLAKLSPSDGQVAQSLERLLEREGRWSELVELWRSHLGDLDHAAAQARRAQIAACLLDRLSSPAEALEEAFHLLGDGAATSATAAVGIVERVFAFPGAPAPVRMRALGALRKHYAESGQTGEIIRVLGVALASADPADRPALHREIADLLVGEGREVEALDHYAELLVLDPESEDASQRLRELGHKTGELGRYAAALARAADACGEGALQGRAVALLSEAARVRADELVDPAGATALYERLFRTAGVPEATMLEVCRRLDGLLPEVSQRAARLEVLERRSLLEPGLDEKRRLRAEAARLADALGDADRSLRSWELVLADQPGDREAHEAVINVLEREQRWEPLIGALVRSADAPGARDAARDHRVRAARVHHEKLNAPDAAVAAWREIEAKFGQSEETIDALVTLLGAASRWDELSAVLEHGLELTLDPVRRQSLLQQLGDLYRTALSNPERALFCYRAVLAEQPAHAGARAGLAELLSDPACRAEATEMLLHAFEETGDWEGRLSLLEHRLEAAKDAAARTALLLEAADLYEDRAGNGAAALRAVARALPLSPHDTAIEARLSRLAEATSAWATAADALGLAVDASPPGARAADLHFHRGAILEDRLGDPEGALSAYLSSLSLAEDRLDVAAAAVRAATRAGQWDVAARTVVSSARARAETDAGIVGIVAEAAHPESWDRATAALAEAVDADQALPAALAGELLRTVAVWHRDHRGDPAAAEEVLLRALTRGGGGIDTLEMLAGVQRRAPGRPLVDTLLALAGAGQNTLASLHEAARVAVEVLGDAALSRSILERLLGEVAARLHEGERTYELADLASFAVEKLVRLAEAEGNHDRAVGILVDAATLPLGAEAARERLHEAAHIAEELLGDAGRAVSLYRRILADHPSDARAITRLSAIFEAEGSIVDLLALRRHELGLAEDTSAKIALRLSIAALLGRAGDAEARLTVLRDNLADEPGHAQSLEELAALLEGGARHADLAALLEGQAGQLEAVGAAERAADLWTRASEIAESRLRDTKRALEDRRRAAAGRPTAETFDALARLSTALGDHASAVGWLEKRLEALDPSAADDRVATVARLAEALGGAGRAAEARACLERGLAEAPGAEALRAPLRGLYRAASAWDALVALLTSSLGDGGAPPKADELREAADVCIKKLGSRERAIPILEAMVALTPTDKPARMALAGALRGAGDLERARGILAGLLDEYGRRRPPERAEVHFQLAQVAAAAGNGAEAKAQLETATSMSTEHPGALRMLAGLYRDAGDMERAERMFGALLLIAVRQKPGTEDDPERPARSEVMINLFWIFTKLNQKGRADEMLASAFEAARRSELEARRLETTLREAGDNALYLRALEERLANGELTGPARAAVLSDMAELLGGPLDRPDDAFKALLGALELDPGNAALRDRAAGMARRAGAIARWADVLVGLAEQAESEGRTALAAGLFLALGEIRERDLGDAAQALAFYQRSERLGADPVPTWRAIVRAAAAVGDTGEQIRVLRQLTFAGDAAGDPAAQTDDIYRLAELELGSPDDLVAGLGSLEWALGREPRWDRAGKMLRAAADLGGDPSVLTTYERVARSSGDPAMLLDALERAAAAGSAGMDIVREAVELASAAGDASRVDALLRRAVAIGESSGSGMVDAVWALVKLAAAAEAAGDFSGALDQLGRAVEFADTEEAARLCRLAVTIAEEKLGNPARAAEAWERLLAREPNDREVWTPLLGVYRRMGDQAVLEGKLRDAIECAFDAGWRAELRMERARLLEATRPDEACAELDNVLQENEDNEEAATILIRLYERQGREQDLASLLDRRLSLARSRDDGAVVLSLSLRLGEMAARERPDQAIEIYRAALDTAPESVELLGRLLALYAGDDHVEDRADVLERMVKLEKGREGAERALSLADLRSRLGDEDGAVRALELGFHADPTMSALRDRLAALYTGGERWNELARMLEAEGTAGNVASLREAAALYLDRLDQPEGAARALMLASERAPDDIALLVDLSRCLARAGDVRGGRDRVSSALERGVIRQRDRVALLRLRAELSPDDQDHALADLEAAYRVDPAGVARELAECLDRRRIGAGADDQALLLRFVDLLLDLNEGERARDALLSWTDNHPGDTTVLTRALELEAFSGRWDTAVQFCERLVEASHGPDRVEAALLLTGACAQAGYPHDARTVLEQVISESPQDARIRDSLRRIYEESGAHRELANLYLTEARLAADPADRFAALRRAGSLLMEQAGDPASAIAPLEAARDLRPRDNETAMLLADAYIHSGKLQEAADFLDAAIQGQKGRRSREASMMQQRMAAIARAVGDRSNELAWLNAAFESDAQNGEAASALVDVATELGQLEVALKALKAITLMKNPRPITRAMAYLRQAMIAQHQGDIRKATMLAKKAQSEDPHLEETAAFLQSLSG